MNEIHNIKNYRPLISIITVCYNAEKVIEDTIISVLSQKFNNYEYIIIDGQSSDRTNLIIEKYKARIDYWKSEPDNGIYDAMNKGIKSSTGEWIIFMNAGDTFVNEYVLLNVAPFLKMRQYDVIYGDTFIKDKNRTLLKKALPLNTITLSLPFCHQSVFVRSNIMKNYLFDMKFKIAADYNFFFKIYKLKYKFQHINNIISVYDSSDGISSKQRSLTYKEICIINGRSKGFINRIRYETVSLILKLGLFK